MDKAWKSFDAGVIDIIVGLIITGIGIIAPLAILDLRTLSTMGFKDTAFITIPLGVVLFSLGLFTVYGGEMALKRRRWGLALAASICASLVVFGLPSLILTIISKNEFDTKSSHGNISAANRTNKRKRIDTNKVQIIYFQ